MIIQLLKKTLHKPDLKIYNNNNCTCNKIKYIFVNLIFVNLVKIKFDKQYYIPLHFSLNTSATWLLAK